MNNKRQTYKCVTESRKINNLNYIRSEMLQQNFKCPYGENEKI